MLATGRMPSGSFCLLAAFNLGDYSDTFECPDQYHCWINFPPLDACTGHIGKGMVVIVPTLPKGDHCNPPGVG